jgi:hypothetical protein
MKSKEDLIGTLRAAGQSPRTIDAPDGSTIVVLPHGGRVIGLLPLMGGENFLWTNDALRSPDSARALLEGEAWQNSGGDRTWLSPEADVFFPEFPKLDRYVQPRELDPGDYEVDAGTGAIRLSARLSILLSRSRRRIELEIEKEVSPAPNPLRRERDLRTPDPVEYAGYTLRVGLTIRGPDGSAGPVGIWNLLQLPPGGDLLVPAHSRTVPKVYFGQIRPEDLTVEDRMVRWRMRAEGEHKIGLRAAPLTGRAGYLREAGGRSTLVVRDFFVDPSGEYVDVPWNDPDDFGYAVQACNIASGLGRFSELEYHAPAIGGGTGRSRCEDVSSVWAFRGGEESIREIARRLVGAAG